MTIERWVLQVGVVWLNASLLVRADVATPTAAEHDTPSEDRVEYTCHVTPYARAKSAHDGTGLQPATLEGRGAI
jgi:hypothetical protein